MRQAAVLVTVFFIACSQGQPNSSAVTTPGQSSCRLPISIQQTQGGPQGAFLDFPGGKVTFEANGVGGSYYDRPFSRWLPVPRNAVSEDGSHYAYGTDSADGKPVLHVVDVASAVDRTYSLPAELHSGIGGLDVFEYSNAVLYLGLFTEGAIQALWTFDLATGVTKKVADMPGIGAIDGDVVWRGSLNAGDPNAWSFVPGSPKNQIERLGLGDGSRAVWLYRPGHLVGVIGVDAAHDPIVLDYIDRQTVELLILSSATTQRSIYKGSANTWAGFISGVMADSHGLWLGGSQGIYLYSGTGEVQKVSDQAAAPAGSCA